LPGGDSPFILLDEAPDSTVALSAMRLGATDLMALPLERGALVAAVRSAANKRRELRQLTARTRRLRRLSSRLVKDRRDLRNRVDLICRDIVTAYRRLAEKVVAQDQQIEPTLRMDPDDHR